jgi:hypothetical protein
MAGEILTFDALLGLQSSGLRALIGQHLQIPTSTTDPSTPVGSVVLYGGDTTGLLGITDDAMKTILSPERTSSDGVYVPTASLLQYVAIKQTTDAVLTTMWTHAIPDNTLARYEAYIVGRRAGTATCAVAKRAARVEALSAAYTLVDITSTDETSEDDGTWGQGFNLSGSDVVLQVSGGAFDVNWVAFIDIRQVTN